MKRLLLFFLLATTQAREAEPPAPEAREELSQLIRRHFAEWDADANGLLSSAEIDRCVADPSIVGAEAAAIAALKRSVRQRSFQLPALTESGLLQLVATKPDSRTPDLTAMYRSGWQRLRATRRVLFASGRPRLETIHQGRMGNCFSLAPLAALAQARPDYITQQMIRELPDGRYAVKLGKHVITVTAPTDSEIALTSSSESDGIWVNVYEKAAGEAHNAAKPANKREATGLDALNRGGSAGTQLAFITGHAMQRLSCRFAKDPTLSAAEHQAKLEEMRTALEAAVKERRLMTCGTLKTKIPGITPNHAYAVLHYDRRTDCLTLWNPHGDTTTVPGEPGPENGYPQKDGQFQIPLPVLVKEFAGLAFELLPDA